MKIFRIIFELVLVVLVVIFFIFGWIKKIDADNQRYTIGNLWKINESLNDSIAILNQKIVQFEENSKSE